MRFTADYDSEEEEFPVNDADRGTTPVARAEIDNFEPSSEDDDGEEAENIDDSAHFSPKTNRDAWVRVQKL